MAAPNVKVKQPLNREIIPTEVLADSIVEIAGAMKKLKDSRLTERAVHVLIKDACPSHIGMTEVKAVLKALNELESLYIKKKNS